jgi:glycerate 2-kinase
MTGVPRHPRAMLERVFQGALAAVAPGPAVRRGLEGVDLNPQRWIRVLALGKAAVPMATAAAEVLRERGIRLRDGLVVDARAVTLANPVLRMVAGDHPVPGRRSAEVARALERFTTDGRPGDVVLVLLSGGTSSLIGAPVSGLTQGDLEAIHRLALRAGLPIGEMNRLRRRFSRWAAGRLALALAPADLHVLAISDVPGDAMADIGSGPCSPDPDRAGPLREWLVASGLWDAIPANARAILDAVVAGDLPDTPSQADEVFQRIQPRIIAANADAMRGAKETAIRLGLRATLESQPLSGDAAGMGRLLGRRLMTSPRLEHPECLIWGGETAIALPDDHAARGGRSQELALAAAEVLAAAAGNYPALLAAGTDGVDGQGDAAGAVVDPSTWQRIVAAGRQPLADLHAHRSYDALDSAGALLRTGPTGTNVMDLVLALQR